jgi:hypothetical protein
LTSELSANKAVTTFWAVVGSWKKIEMTLERVWWSSIKKREVNKTTLLNHRVRDL